jgi:glycerol-3-phosphate acyltransferase PlsX
MSADAEHPHSTQPIALDAMGGDLGVSPLLQGAVDAAADDGATVVVVGDAAAGAALQALRPGDNVRFVRADDVVTMGDKPAAAVKKKRSSMRLACDLVAAGEAAAVVSVANSGAMMATSSFVFGRLPGVSRPAIGTVLPSFSPSADGRLGRTLLVDAGANNVCEPLHLAQFGVLGSVYLEHAFGVARPVVAVLSNGEEEHKGTPLTREALALLQRTGVNVVGFCEGRDLNAGAVHVVVTDGFTGNIVLKTAEGVFSFMAKVIKETFENGSVVDNLGGLLSTPGWARIRAELDPREFGAAPLLGLQKPAFIAHGKSDAHAVRSAIRAARRFVDHDVTAHLAAAVADHVGVWAAARTKP